jgi:hypothetical protein
VLCYPAYCPYLLGQRTACGGLDGALAGLGSVGLEPILMSRPFVCFVCNVGIGHMQKAQEVTPFLVPAAQHTLETVHLTLRAFDDPPPSFVPCLLLQRVGLLPRALLGAVHPHSSRTARPSS